MTTVVKVCKFGCGQELGEFDTKQNKYLETDGTLHTRDRCEGLKKGHNNGYELSLELVLKKLEKIGITINMEKLRDVQI
jgi:hypothetical protein